MSDRDFAPPVQRVDPFTEADPLGTFDGPDDTRYRLNFEVEERLLIVRLLGELRDLLTSDVNEQTAPLLHRLFPPAFHDDPDKEAEYQRLMREELVASRLASVEMVTTLLAPDGGDARSDATLSEAETMAFMQSVNAVRLVLGTMLEITDDESAEQADMDDSPEYQLYGFLGWVLEWTVRALSGTPA